MLNVSVIGCGAIGAGVLQMLQGCADIRISSVIVSDAFKASAHEAVAQWASGAQVLASVGAGIDAPDLLVECAGHSAIAEHVLPALERGIPCLVASIGALGAPGMVESLAQAARHGGTQVQLLSGAIGGIDALSAAREGGLDTVVYTGRKPPRAWRGTPAQELCDLDTLTSAFCIFSGSAEQAAMLYPKNANVAATLALAAGG